MRIQSAKNVIALLCALIGFECCVSGQDKYSISNQIDTFLLNSRILFPDINYKLFDSTINKTSNDTAKSVSTRQTFYSNNAVIYFYVNDTLMKYNESSKNSDCFPALVEARFYDDTLRINTGVGFFAGNGVIISISGNTYKSVFFANADGDLIYKYQPNDKDYLSNIAVKAIHENLFLNHKPTFADNENLIGEYYGTFEPLYENDQNSDKIEKMRVKIIFKCVVRNFDKSLQQLKKENKKVD